MNSRILITGNSTGLGRALSEFYLGNGDTVYGVSRRGCTGLNGSLFDIRCDIGDAEALSVALEELLQGVPRLDLVILNAGILGKVQELRETSTEDVRRVMEINVWANKRIVDWLLSSPLAVGQIVAISSGASKHPGRGWGAYAISKAALDMMIGIYAKEHPDIHFSALAPGIIDTAMQEYICTEADMARFPSLEGLRRARENGAMPAPGEAAGRVAAAIRELKALPSGSYADISSLT